MLFLYGFRQNDYGAGHYPTTRQWIDAYSNFVLNITRTYRPAPPPVFFLACGGMANRYCADTQKAVASMNMNINMRMGMIRNKSSGMGSTHVKVQVHYLDLTGTGAGAWSNGTTEGCPGGHGSHPSWVSHELMAAVAVPAVATALNWSRTPN